MIKSIQQFCQDGVKNLEKVMADYLYMHGKIVPKEVVYV